MCQLGNTSGLRQSGATPITLAKLDTQFLKLGSKGLKVIKATQDQLVLKVTEDCRANVVYKACKVLKVTKVFLVLRVLMVKHSTPT